MRADDPFADADRRLREWERRLAANTPLELSAVLEDLTALMGALVGALLCEAERPAPLPDDDLLARFKLLARSDATWNAIRDNLRELVYYRNCLAAGRRDALPAVPERMAIRTARHVYLYMCTRRATAGRAGQA
ncbi:MAG TPA: hypothetical protein VIS77_15500 [Burkholderiales bacterium]